MAELHWLLLILVLLYYYIPIGPIADTDALIIVMVCYAASIPVFRYLGLTGRETRWKLAIETWLMITFITLVMWQTGKAESPLMNLYLLVIIACAITLGKVLTLLEVSLIAACYLLLSYANYGDEIFAPTILTVLMAKFSPIMLVAYVTSLLAADILTANRKIAILSQTDELTGLLNLRAFNLMLDKEIARAGRGDYSFTVIMIDLDNLKTVNDRHGHEAGSQLLQNVAAAIGNRIRAADILARYGGDEYVALLPDTGASEACIAAERIRKAISNAGFDYHGRQVHTTASIGIATFPDGVREVGEILDKADLAMYRSKFSGRNRHTYYDTTLECVSAIA